MTERYAQITARIEAIHQLGAVVNAMRGIAGARAAQARAELAAADGYAGLIAAAIRRVLALLPPAAPGSRRNPQSTAIVAFGAEQGFVGGFTDRVLDALAAVPPGAQLFLVGTRAAATAAERGLAPVWRAALPSHPPGIPRLASQIADAVFTRIAAGNLDRLEAIWCDGDPASPVPGIVHRRLFPLEPAGFPIAPGSPPLLNLAPARLLETLTEDYVHAQLCMAALHAFAAENVARMEAMAAAHGQIDRKLADLEATQRQVRQEEITAEIIELAAGESAARSARGQA